MKFRVISSTQKLLIGYIIDVEEPIEKGDNIKLVKDSHKVSFDVVSKNGNKLQNSNMTIWIIKVK